MLTDGAHRKKGKFIKKGTHIYSQVQVERYNFSEIRKQAVIYPDNPGYNIIHQRFHSEQDLSEGINPDTKTQEDLIAKSHQAPVIFPRDFTADWAEEKRKARKRHALKDVDDDEFEMAMEEEEEKERRARAEAVAARSRRGRKPGAEQEGPVELQSEETDPDIPSPLKELQSPQFSAPEQSGFKLPAESLEQAGKDLQRFAPDAKTPDQISQNTEHTSTELYPDQNVSDPEDSSPAEQNFEASTDSSVLSDPSKNPDHEMPDKTPSSESSEETLQSHFESGFQEGYKKAEQDLIQKLQNENLALARGLQQGMDQLKTLRKDILSQAQDNFLEIAGALTEAIFDKALKADPGLIKTVIEKAIREGMDQDKLVIRTHPELLEDLQKMSQQTDQFTWTSDPSLSKGEFLIESGDTTIRNNLKDMISDMLSGLDLSLYDPEQSDDDQT